MTWSGEILCVEAERYEADKEGKRMCIRGTKG